MKSSVSALQICLVVFGIAAGVVLGTAEGAGAQQPSQPGGAQPSATQGAPQTPPQMQPTPQMQQMHQMAQMCRQMMGGVDMGGPAMMSGIPITGDAKRDAEMIAMHGEMMKAMGEVMMKYAQRLRPTP